jgi:omega-amidase
MNSYCYKRAAQLLATVSVLQSSTVTAFHRSVTSSILSRSSQLFAVRLPCKSRPSSLLSIHMSSTASNIQEMSQTKNRVALLQFHVTYDKSQNISTARQYITKAREAGARLCVLPECWNSPYATAAFGEYSETLPNVGDMITDDNDKWGPSTQMLMEMAKSSDMYIVGGSVPEISSDGKLYNTCLIINPLGKVVGKHRKVHLFDIDVPGGIRFIESETLSAGDGATYFDVDTEMGLGRIGVGIW